MASMCSTRIDPCKHGQPLPPPTITAPTTQLPSLHPPCPARLCQSTASPHTAEAASSTAPATPNPRATVWSCRQVARLWATRAAKDWCGARMKGSRADRGLPTTTTRPWDCSAPCTPGGPAARN